MKNMDVKNKLVVLKTTELQKVKGGYKHIPQGYLVEMARFSRWEELEIRFGGHGGTKKNTGRKNKSQSIMGPK